MDKLEIKRALLSVTNKDGLEDLARFLVSKEVEIVSTGGTFKFLQEREIAVTTVSAVTDFPEIMDGRVKTLHPGIHAGILADKSNPGHVQTLTEQGIKAFDLVCVNLYDFSSALDQERDAAEMVENIDVGGPCMLRAAAKNYQNVLVLPEPFHYKAAMAEMKKGAVSLGFRLSMAALTMQTTSAYDALIAAWMRSEMPRINSGAKA